jgi:hypothetical protein|tara:strand:+ start:871 stop:1374 length:504 start_codon:yes stop_codon:yes gene_type:complete
MKILYLHGLESEQGGPKVDFLCKEHYTLAPDMDYRDPTLYERTLDLITRFQPDTIIGSSMGGWFAYNLGIEVGVPVLLLNPALHSRTYEPNIPLRTYTKRSEVFLALGMEDDIIDAKATQEWMHYHNSQGYIPKNTYKGSHGHRTPFKVFCDIFTNFYLPKITKEVV